MVFIGSLIMIALCQGAAMSISSIYENAFRNQTDRVPKKQTKYYLVFLLVISLIKQYLIWGMDFTALRIAIFIIAEIVLIFLFENLIEFPIIIHHQKYKDNPRLLLSEGATLMPPVWHITAFIIAFYLVSIVLEAVLL